MGYDALNSGTFTSNFIEFSQYWLDFVSNR
jgi:hypothetical protein